MIKSNNKTTIWLAMPIVRGDAMNKESKRKGVGRREKCYICMISEKESHLVLDFVGKAEIEWRAWWAA